MSVTSIEVELLEDGADDSYGLWEVVWRMRTRDPDRSEVELIEISQEVIRGLLSRGLISLYKSITQPYGQFLEPLGAEEIGSSLWDTRFWQAPEASGAMEIWFSTSERGVQVVRDAISRNDITA